MHYGREWCPHTATAAEVYSRLSAAERRDIPGCWSRRRIREIQRHRRAHHRQAGADSASLDRLLKLPQHVVDLPPTLEALAAAL